MAKPSGPMRPVTRQHPSPGEGFPGLARDARCRGEIISPLQGVLETVLRCLRRAAVNGSYVQVPHTRLGQKDEFNYPTRAPSDNALTQRPHQEFSIPRPIAATRWDLHCPAHSGDPL